MASGFAAFMAAALLTRYTSVLNSSVTLYVCDLHEKFVAENPNVGRLNTIVPGACPPGRARAQGSAERSLPGHPATARATGRLHPRFGKRR